MDPFEEGEQTLIRLDYHHHADLEEPGEDFEQGELKGRRRPRSVPRSNREKKCCSGKSPNQRLRLTSGEKKNHL